MISLLKMLITPVFSRVLRGINRRKVINNENGKRLAYATTSGDELYVHDNEKTYGPYETYPESLNDFSFSSFSHCSISPSTAQALPLITPASMASFVFSAL